MNGFKTVPNQLCLDVLYLVHRLPYPPDKGDRIRAFHLLRYLSSQARVHLACFADEVVPEESIATLRRYCARLAIVPLKSKSRWFRALRSVVMGGTVTEGAFSSPELHSVLEEWTRGTRFDAAFASSSGMVSYLQKEGIRHVPSIVDLVDVDSEKWLEYGQAGRGPRAWLYRLEGRRLRRLEQQLPRWARAVTLVSEPEADIYRGFCAAGAVEAITNGVDLDHFQPTEAVTDESCVFVGALDYRPNVEGACWFCREVWPEVRRQRPAARLRLVGRRPAVQVQRLARLPGVELVGQVPDVRPHIARSAVVVVPLQIARGVQNKVLEALAMAKATVASPAALTGLKARPGVEVLTASTPAEWIETVTRLFRDAKARAQLGLAGRAYAEQFHRWETCLEPFGRLLGPHAEGPSVAQAEQEFLAGSHAL